MANSARKLLIEGFGTDGEIITWDASALFATVTAGTTGHVLTSNGAGAAPTFQSGDGTLVLLASSSASSSANIDFTSGIDSTYDEYKFFFIDLVPATNATSIWVRTSTDGGSTFDSSASNYEYGSLAYDSAGSPSAVNSTGDTKIVISPATSNASTDSYFGMMTLYAPSNSSADTTINYLTGGVENGGASSGLTGTSRRNTNADVDAIRFLMSSGNITSGDFYMYGVKGA